ncbi:DNA adenine methylase, partial [Acidithiobacillus ferrooxidans]|nr:DNA adenine methylase [Acidithiobacillus ferrooxidans]
RRPVGIEVINDRNGDVMHFFRILRDQGDALREYLQNTPYARALYAFWSAPRYRCGTDLERAARTFFLARASFMAMAQRDEDRAPVGFAVAKYLDNRARAMMKKVDDELVRVRDRLRHVVIENEDVLEIIDRYDSENAVLYCDPPYVEETRKGGGYAFEYSDEDHVRLLERLKQSPGYVAISGYAHPIYAEALESQGWERHDFPLHCNTVRNIGVKTDLDAQRMESLWLNQRLREYHHTRSTRQSVLALEFAAI